MWPLAATIVGIVVVIVLRMPLGELLNRVKGISKKGVKAFLADFGALKRSGFVKILY